ncbi:hypothetical protein TanjilG_25887 [Lupinus angustifolius]|uniref:RING-type domain-containing protein n=1 Tax=Lupinus angustifolius TaxID=3871 RepID=A0A1J7G2X8_LUPAN|nr:PREDICTED: MND1-interacting protein 1-like [Lupinus angustifolius]XP_019422108.1 PREDICTED: MND1-interacting protein 1-like [Lupinus angustifolius]OIV94663.1 hypothetical protein TanjilG_25887 [Lupinus angustifolius]
MGCTVREKHIQANRKSRSQKPNCNANSRSKSMMNHVDVTPKQSSSNSNPNPNPNDASSGWGLCTEDQLEHILLKKMEIIYNDAVSKLVALGYEEDVALRAILQNGHYHGPMDVLTNILHNTLGYLSNDESDSESESESETVFTDLKQLVRYSLAGMVSLLQQLRPNLCKGDAMWCLLITDFHIEKATNIQIPVSDDNAVETGSGDNFKNVFDVMPPPLCRFHGGWGFGNGGTSQMTLQLQRDIEFPKRFNLSPQMKSMLKRNVAMFAAGFRANSNQLHPKAVPRSSFASSSFESPSEKSGDSHNLNNLDAVNSVLLSKFRDLNLDEKLDFVAEDKKGEVIVNLFRQIKDLEKQVKDRKEWAHQKAMQAARKLSGDLTELKILRMEREETQRLKKGKQTLEGTTMKRLSEMENNLKKASGQVDHANASVRKLEIENAEIKAEMEASKLSASESVMACLQIAKREKNYLKKLLACEKQKAKLQQEISDGKQKILEIQEELAQIKKCKKEAKVKLGEELKAKEEALALIEEERHAKEVAEANHKRNLKALQLNIEIDFQRRKDDILRLEQELARLKASAHSDKLHHKSNTSRAGESEGAKLPRETIAMLLQDLDNLEDFSEKEVSSDRQCIICNKDEVSIVFLPCAHQVMCASCSEEYGRKGRAACPCCWVPIEQRIRVFGASS